jgi:HPt (histidine-containing phosphotransfer) domain-containing protein
MDDYLAKPVRPEEVRRIIERWAAKAVEPGPAGPTMAQTATATGTLEPQPGPSAPAVEEEPPVDLDRLNDFTNGSLEDLRDLVNLYLKQTSGQVEQLAAAVKAASATEVRRIAHSCAGASATCGMVRIVPILRELEHHADEGNLSNAPELSRKVEEEFNRIRIFLEGYMAKQSALAAQT